MDGEWFTYSQLAEKFGSTAQSMRMKTIRCQWRRQLNNEGKTVVLLPANTEIKTRKKKTTAKLHTSTPVQKQSNNKDLERVIAALEAHIVSLNRELEFVNKQLTAEQAAAAESLEFIKKLSNEIALLKSGSTQIQEKPKEIPTEEQLPITGISTILRRLELLKAAKNAA